MYPHFKDDETEAQRVIVQGQQLLSDKARICTHAILL